jgi:DNA-directed RNA polymerase specialized sigma24 family protein
LSCDLSDAEGDTLLVDLPDRSLTPEEAWYVREIWQQVEAVLTPGQRQFFAPHYRDGVPIEDLAKACGCGRHDVDQALCAARKRVRDRIGEAELSGYLAVF